MVGRQPKHARPATMAGITIDSKVLVPTALAGAAGQVGPGAGQVCGDGGVALSLEFSEAELGI